MYTSVIIYMYDPEIAKMFDAYREMMPEMMAAMGMEGMASSLLEWIKVYLFLLYFMQFDSFLPAKYNHTEIFLKECQTQRQWNIYKN